MAYGSEDDDEGVGPISATTKASEDSLGKLHGIVAEYLSLKLMTGKATAAEVGAAITFLKNNSITASASKNEALERLSKTMAERRTRKGGLTPMAAAEAEQAFGDLMSGSMGLPQ